MNRDYELNYKSLLKEINKSVNLSYKRDLKFNLTHFTIFRKGKLFSNSSTWEISDFTCDSFFLSFKNSYETRKRGVEDGSSPGIIDHIEFRQIGILIKSNMELPNLIIRPFYFGERIANVFLKFDVELSDREKFNKKYVLESKSDNAQLEDLLSKNLTLKMSIYDDFCLEIIDSNILMKFENDFSKEKAFALFDIANLIDKRLKSFYL